MGPSAMTDSKVSGWELLRMDGENVWWSMIKPIIRDRRRFGQCHGWKDLWRPAIHNFNFSIGIAMSLSLESLSLEKIKETVKNWLSSQVIDVYD